MIKSFRSKGTEDLYHGIDSQASRKIPQTIRKVAERKLDMINAAVQLEDLKAPPGNRLEALRGSLAGKYSVRINDQYRVLFAFKDGNAFEVEITDYH